MRFLPPRPSDVFFDDAIRRILDTSNSVLDIGGGLRLDRTRSNRVNPQHAWILEAFQKKGVTYRILDYVDTYHPDVVGDIQNLPLQDASEEAIVCLSILEHVENPFKAAAEMHRVLKPGGLCFVYVPFLYYYHAEKGYYGDYWRFTEDSLRLLFKDFSSIALTSVRGPIETLVRLSPLGRWSFFCWIGQLGDLIARKYSSKQTSGYNVLLVK